MKLIEQGYKMIGVATQRQHKLFTKKERKKQFTHVNILDDVFILYVQGWNLYFLQHLHSSFICWYHTGVKCAPVV